MLLKVNEENIRLDLYLAKELKITRNKAQELIDLNLVFVNKFNRKSSHKLKLNDEIEVLDKEEAISDLKAFDIDLDIRYEDDDLLVLNKPANLVVHPSFGHQHDSLVNALINRIKLSNGSESFRPGIVHRIDKDTSGLLIIAKNDFAHVELSEQIRNKIVHRHYLALVHGNIEINQGTIKGKIGRDPKDRKKMAINQDGRESVTHFNVIERFGEYTLIECILDTGRTHQIRVHLKAIGHPLVGDKVYQKSNKLYNKGQLLHAYKLSLIQPVTAEEIIVEAEPPDHFVEILTNLKEARNK